MTRPRFDDAKVSGDVVEFARVTARSRVETLATSETPNVRHIGRRLAGQSRSPRPVGSNTRTLVDRICGENPYEKCLGLGWAAVLSTWITTLLSVSIIDLGGGASIELFSAAIFIISFLLMAIIILSAIHYCLSNPPAVPASPQLIVSHNPRSSGAH
jgi:hypothetical protein